MLQRYINKIKRKLGIQITYPSETSKVRHLVLKYCNGYGCDIGFGGDKIVKDAIGIDFQNPYAKTGEDNVDIACDVINESIPVEDNTYDYVYSSHLIEDFENTKDGLKKFIRILKNHGNLILVFPDQEIYEKICLERGQELNTYHKHKNMGLTFMKNNLDSIDDISYEILYESNCKIDYNVILVIKIFKNGVN